MGLEQHKPRAVRAAQVTGNVEVLRRMGSKGGKKSAENAEIRAAQKEREEARVRAEETARIVEANEHILTPEGDDVQTAGD